MFKVENIKDNNDYVIFFKIIEKKYIDNFRKDGQVYFGLLKDYRRKENDGQAEIGDSFEASQTLKVQEYMGNSDMGYVEIHGPNAGNNIRINANQCAFCFYALGLKHFEKKSETKFIHTIPRDLLKKLCKDKGGVENCVIMSFDDEFENRIKEQLKTKGLPFESGKVVYDNYDYIPRFFDDKNKYALECCFHKRTKYTYQNEYRIVALNTEDKPITDLCVDASLLQLEFTELKSDCDFVCEINLISHEIGKICTVEYTTTYSLDNRVI